jgi:hypothetical protein
VVQSFDTGDKVSSDVSPVTLVMEEGTKLLLHQYSSVSFSRDAQGRPVVRLEKGSIHFISPKGGSQPIVVQVLDKPSCEKAPNSSFVMIVKFKWSAWWRAVSPLMVWPAQRDRQRGKELNLANGNLYDYQYADDNRNRMHDIRLAIYSSVITPLNRPAQWQGQLSRARWTAVGSAGSRYNTEFTVNNGQVRMVVPHGSAWAPIAITAPC